MANKEHRRTTKAPRFSLVSAAQPGLFLGVDGGGTKTLAVLADRNAEILSQGKTAASNPLRVGVEASVREIADAVDAACDALGKSRSDIIAAEIGLAGVRREDLRLRMRDSLQQELGIEKLEVATDAEIALYGATDGRAGLVIIAGTGSICCGRNEKGEIARSGGWGPLAGDEGGGAGIARRALQQIAKASDGRGEKTKLSEYACKYFRADSADDLAMAIYAPSMTNDKIAGFARLVVQAAREKDAVAIDLLKEAANELGLAANAVIKNLGLEKKKFQVAYVGGIFHAENLIFEPLLEKIHETAPAAFLAPPLFTPAVAAAKMALAAITPPKIERFRNFSKTSKPLSKQLRPLPKHKAKSDKRI
ncbi:MAG: BadF/BadG/BcrA/BcrD ATPase family protein [Pyrinomonadaceae bacterium]